jgi:hypothetical protein
MTTGQERVVIGVLDFVSSDGSVIITAEEFAELERRCPSIRDVRRMARAACRGWLRRLPERKRKQVLIQWLLEKAETMRPPKPKARQAETMHAPKPEERPRASVGEQGYWERSLPKTVDEYAARFISEGDDEETRRGVLSRAREVFERRQSRYQ